MDREGNVVDVMGLRGLPGETGPAGPRGETGADGKTPHIGENGNWFIGDTDTGVPAGGEGGASGIITETDPTVFAWAKSHLPFTAEQLSDMASGAGFYENPTNFADGKTYFRYHAGATSFAWTNPNPQTGAVTITVLAWSQYGDKTAANQFSRLVIVYGDGSTEYLWLTNGQTVSMTTDANKVLAEIRGNYDHENWVLLDMSVLSIVADYPAPTGTSAEVMTGASATAAGKAGLVPAPAAGDNEKFLAGDGTWKVPESSGGGTDLSLGVTGATVGQTVRITAVDDTGKPTAWEAVDDEPYASVTLGGTVYAIQDYTDGVITVDGITTVNNEMKFFLRKYDYSSYIAVILAATGTDGQFTIKNEDGTVITPSIDTETWVIEQAEAQSIAVNGLSGFKYIKIRITTPRFMTHGARSSFMLGYGGFGVDADLAKLTNNAAEYECETFPAPINGYMYSRRIMRAKTSNAIGKEAVGYSLVTDTGVPDEIKLSHYNNMLTIGTKMEVWGKS